MFRKQTKTEAPDSPQSDLQQKKGLQSQRAAAGALLLVLDVALCSPSLLVPRHRLSWAGATQTARPCSVLSSSTNSVLQAGANWNKSISKNKYSIPLLDCPICGKQISALRRPKHAVPKYNFFFFPIQKIHKLPSSFPSSPAIPGETRTAKQRRNEVRYALLLISW